MSVILLGFVMETLPVGTAYAIWAGIGAVGTAILAHVEAPKPKGWLIWQVGTFSPRQAPYCHGGPWPPADLPGG